MACGYGERGGCGACAECGSGRAMEVRKSLVVNATPLETRIALLENGQLCELFIERTASRSQVGDVYKGRVAKLLPGMQSAFVSIGGAKDGFLYLDDPGGPRLEADTLS